MIDDNKTNRPPYGADPQSLAKEGSGHDSIHDSIHDVIHDAIAIYDTIGKGYARFRRPDRRIAAQLHAAWGAGSSLLNIGAGTGSYETRDGTQATTIALDVSERMLGQRPDGLAPAVRGRAERLPFAAQSFDVATAILTLHHWNDVAAGLREACRVARRVVLLTWIGFPTGFWLDEYFPQIPEADKGLFPSPERLRQLLGDIKLEVVPIPHDCTDGFLCAYWRRPERYLDADARQAISSFSRIGDVTPAVERLRRDVESGAWDARFGALRQRASMDYGYRIVSAEVSPR